MVGLGCVRHLGSALRIKATQRHFCLNKGVWKESERRGLLWQHRPTWVSRRNADRRVCVCVGFMRSPCALIISMLHSDWSLRGLPWGRRSCCGVCLVTLLGTFLLFELSSCQRRQLSDQSLLPRCRIYRHSLRRRAQGLYSSQPPVIRLHLSIAICALASMCLTLFSFFFFPSSPSVKGVTRACKKKKKICVVGSQTDFIGHISHPCRENS